MENIKDYRIKIITGRYKDAPLEQKEMIQQLFGENAEHKYEIYFHWYNIIHELGHAIMMFNSPSRPHPVDEEQLVNNFAYSYWKYYGEQAKLKELSSIVEDTIRKLKVPAQNNESYIDYAKNKWGTEELFTFNNYGWFQFSSVRAAIAAETNLEQALSQKCSAAISPEPAEFLDYEIGDQMAVQVVGDAARLLKKWGVILPEDISIAFCDDVNCHRCQVEDCASGNVY